VSAWIVSKAHIDALVLAGVQWQLTDPSRTDLSEVGRMLWAECLASVAYRYPGDTGHGDRPGPAGFHDEEVAAYRFAPVELVLAPHTALKLLDCYDYQSCEHPGWVGSAAQQFTATLRERITDRLGRRDGSYRDHPLYAAAPWGVDSLAELTAQAPA
jgi:hypothetical protein